MDKQQQSRNFKQKMATRGANKKNRGNKYKRHNFTFKQAFMYNYK